MGFGLPPWASAIRRMELTSVGGCEEVISRERTGACG